MSLYHYYYYYKIKAKIHPCEEDMSLAHECVIEIITKHLIIRDDDELYWNNKNLQLIYDIQSMQELEFETTFDCLSIPGFKFHDDVEVNWTDSDKNGATLYHVLNTIRWRKYRRESSQYCDCEYAAFVGNSLVVAISPHDNGEFSDTFTLIKALCNPTTPINDIMNEQKEFIQLYTNLLIIYNRLYNGGYVNRIFNFEHFDQRDDDYHEVYRKLAAVNFEPDLKVSSCSWNPPQPIDNWAYYDDSRRIFDDDIDVCCKGLYVNFVKFKQLVKKFKELYLALPQTSEFYKNMKFVC